MKYNESNLEKEFGHRLVALRDGRQGLRGGLHCDIKEVLGEEPILDFVASDETLDRYNEIIKSDGWQLDNFKKNPVIVDCHDYSSIAKIIGRSPTVGVIDGKLVNRVEFATANPLGNLCWKMAKAGFIRSESVGFIPLEWTNGNKVGEPDRTYLQQELLEISLVVVPANPSATIGAAYKSGAIGKSDLRELAKFLECFLKTESESVKCPKCGTPMLCPKCNPKEFSKDADAIKCPKCGADMLCPKCNPKEFCSNTADPDTNTRALGAGVNDAQLLQLARSVRELLKH